VPSQFLNPPCLATHSETVSRLRSRPVVTLGRQPPIEAFVLVSRRSCGHSSNFDCRRPSLDLRGGRTGRRSSNSALFWRRLSRCCSQSSKLLWFCSRNVCSPPPLRSRAVSF